MYIWDEMLHCAVTDKISVWCSELAALQSRLLVLVQAYDMVAEDDKSQAEAVSKFEDLLDVMHCSPYLGI